MGLDIRKEYEYVMNLRDLNWVRQLMLEKQLLDRPSCQDENLGPPQQDMPWQLLDNVRTVIRRAEDSVMYIKEWSNLYRLGVDFDEAECCRCRALPPIHPCNLIRPYLVISGAWEGY